MLQQPLPPYPVIPLLLENCKLRKQASFSQMFLCMTPSATAAQLRGAVTLHLNNVPQHVSSSITVTILNQTNQTMLFPDHLTNCSVILLQMEPLIPGSPWQIVAPCRSERMTLLHTLAPGKFLFVTLTPPYGQWLSGFYRAQLSYVLSGANHQPGTVFTSTFIK